VQFIATLFWITVIMLIYIYFGYPLLLLSIVKFKPKSKKEFMDEYIPVVSFIIPARNEEHIIDKKIQNTLNLDYPKEHLQIIIVSDQSTDRTNQRVKQYASKGVQLVLLSERQGKTGAQNMVVKEAKGEVLVFSDANAMYVKDALKHLVKHFLNSEVGCVSGELCYHNSQKTAVGVEENWYWKYDKWIKKQEDKFGTIIGANGSIYAVRRTAYVPLEKHIISDFIEPLVIAFNGWKVVYEPKAISFEESSKTFEDELHRKKRIISRSLLSLIHHRHLLNPFKNIILFFELISHKLLRWATPFLLILLFLINAGLFFYGEYQLLLWIQIAFYSLSATGFIIRNIKMIPSFLLAPFYFCLLQYASLKGVVSLMQGKKITFWDPIRRVNCNE